jgi:hypothetical protein
MMEPSKPKCDSVKKSTFDSILDQKNEHIGKTNIKENIDIVKKVIFISKNQIQN